MNSPDFDLLLHFLNPDRKMAGLEYENKREKLIKFFECNCCYHAEECADKTFDRIIKIIKERSENKKDEKLSILGVAYYILKEYWRNPIKKNVPFDNLPESQQPVAPPDSIEPPESESFLKEQRHNCMRKCFIELSPDLKKLLVRYFKGEKRARINNRKKLAKELGANLTTLRTKVCRIREKLQDCLNKCLEPILSAC